MTLISKKIKSKNIIIDKDTGEATVIITIHGVSRNEVRMRVVTNDIIPMVIKEGVEILDVIKRDLITNRSGEATGTWIFKIPTTDPENSTTTVLKRRNKKQEKKSVVEEDWNIGPED